MDRLLHDGGEVRPGLLLAHPDGRDRHRGLAQPDAEDYRESEHDNAGRPPDDERDDCRKTTDRGHLGDPDAAVTDLGGDLVDVAVDAVEQFADRGRVERREVLAERDSAQVATDLGGPVGGQGGGQQADPYAAEDAYDECDRHHDEQRQ